MRVRNRGRRDRVPVYDGLGELIHGLNLALRRGVPMLVALALAALILSFAPPHTVGPAWQLTLLAILAAAWVQIQPRTSRRDDLLPAFAVLLSALGLALVARVSPQLAQKQQWWLFASFICVIVVGPACTNFRRLAAYKYLWVLGSLALFVLLLVFGETINGAKLWIAVGSLHFEPIEFIKLFIVFFLAAYLAETADVIAKTRAWSLRANAKYLGPLFLGWGVSVAILVLQRDLGMAALLLVTFATLLYVATRRLDIVVAGFAIFALAALWAIGHFAYVHTRVAVWRNPFSAPLGAGYQSSQGYYALSAGGLFGTGYRLGHPGFIPDASTDYIFAAFSEEFGWIGASLVLAIFLGIVRRILAIAREQPDLYSKLLAVGLGATLGFQVFIIVGGVIGVFPLTGITLPFISYGGSSLVANFLLIALVWAISGRHRQVTAGDG